jgi:hypothetical protein
MDNQWSKDISLIKKIVINISSRALGVWLLDAVWIGWLDLLHLYIQLVTISNYNTIADFHTTDH